MKSGNPLEEFFDNIVEEEWEKEIISMINQEKTNHEILDFLIRVWKK
jgi:hypothetical protein